MKRIIFFCLLIPVSLALAEEGRVDTAELQSIAGQQIIFENYEGVPEKVETLSQIRGIGSLLASSEARSSTGRYSILRARDPSTPTGLEADIFILEPSATVDHIRNLRWIIGTYLETQYGYDRKDADLLSYFITIYNAVYRLNISFFQSRYKQVVISYLDPQKVGLARTYREWPGKTQIVIPISGAIQKGILSIETRTLTEPAVIEELKKEEDRGIPIRKEMVELKERQLKEEERQIQEDKQALQREREALEALEKQKETTLQPPTAKKEESQVSQVSTPLTPSPSKPTTVDTPVTEEAKQAAPVPPQPVASTPEPTPAATPTPPASTSEAVTAREATATPAPTPAAQTLESRQQALEEREKELQKKQEEIREERIAIAKDQQELLEQRAQQAGDTVPFLYQDAEGPKLVRVSREGGRPIVISPEAPIAQSVYFSFGGGYLVVLSRSTTVGRLALLDPVSLKARVTSREEVSLKGKVTVEGNLCFAVIREGTRWFVGKFDSTLALIERSRLEVIPETDLAIHEGKLYVQAVSGEVITLKIGAIESSP
ncbi:MAG: P83/100 family protein [Spirochaetales bacterium]